MTTTLPELHDAVLASMTIRWEDGRTDLVVRPVSVTPHDVTLRLTGVTRLMWPRQAPWGFSLHINRVDGPIKLDETTQQLQIEMQSGDTIEIDYQDLVILPRELG
jgi:hypothetical protein